MRDAREVHYDAEQRPWLLFLVRNVTKIRYDDGFRLVVSFGICQLGMRSPPGLSMGGKIVLIQVTAEPLHRLGRRRDHLVTKWSSRVAEEEIPAIFTYKIGL